MKKTKPRQVGKSIKAIDKKLKAKKVGWRKVDKTKKKYFENRANRSDKDRRKRL